MRLVILAVAITAAVTATADACPPGPCLKYRQPPPPPQQLVVNTYQRLDRAPPVRLSRSRVIKLLTGSSWGPVIDQPVLTGTPMPPRIRFITAATIKRETRRANERVVLVREISFEDNGEIFVDVDGDSFKLFACQDFANKRTSCLVRAPKPVHDELEFEGGGNFAKPPN